jgi:hypothetical protein
MRETILTETTPDDEAMTEFLEWERKEHEAAFKLQSCTIVGPYTLHLTFTDCQKIIDFRPFLFHPMAKAAYLPLKDLEYFNQVKVELHHLTWPNRMTFNPAMLYFWDELAAEKWIND